MSEVRGATFGELVRDLAEEAGLADYIRADATDNKAGIPEDPHDLDAVRRAVNRGYDRFLRHFPRWSFLIQSVRLTMDSAGIGPLNLGGEAARYRLPSWITSRPRGNWRYIDASTQRGEIITRDHQSVERALQGTPATGTPLYAAVREIPSPDTIGGLGHAFEAMFYPVPDAAYVVEAEFRVRKHTLVDLAERHIAGPDHDRAVLDCARYEWWNRDAADPMRLAVAEKDMAESLAKSMEIDVMNRPRNMGRMTDPELCEFPFVDDDLNATVTYNGASLA